MIRRLAPLLAFLAVGCRAATPPPEAARFRGPTGEPVDVATIPANRIVSTLQSATEWLVQLGAADHLVARTDFDRQPELASLPSIGGGLDVSPEAIVALHPDVVIGWRIAASATLAHTLAPFGIPLVALEATDTAQAFEQLAAVGRLVSREDSAAALARSLRQRLADQRTRSCPAGREPETVFVVLSTEPPVTSGRGTWMSELVQAACLRNLFDDVPQPWPPVALEAIVERQPRWILTSRGTTPDARRAELLDRPGWQQLEAVKAGRILELDHDLFARSGPGMADWVAAVIAEKARVEGRQ